MKNNDSAFPVLDSYVVDGGQLRIYCEDFGMTLKQYAAIKLKVPRSGDPEIDKWILENRRADFAQAAIAGVIAEANQYFINQQAAENIAGQALTIADAVLAEWEKEKNNV
jgi:hypothetical protein